MSEQLNNLLLKAYQRYKNTVNPPVPIETIKKFLEFEGISLDQEERGYNFE